MPQNISHTISHNIPATLARLEEKSQQHYFGYVLNLFIREVRHKDGSRNIDEEDFVTIDELGKEWLPRFYQDIIDSKIDTRSPNFWERWDYYTQQIDPSEQPEIYFQAEETLQPIKKGHRKSAYSRKQRKKNDNQAFWYKRTESRKDLSGFNKFVLAQWREETIIEEVYNAILLEKSATNQMIDVKAMPLQAIIEYLWENKKTDDYSDEEYEEIKRIYDTFKLTSKIADERRMLTNSEILELSNKLMGLGFRTKNKVVGRGKNSISLTTPAKKASATMASIIDNYNQDAEKHPRLVAIARLYNALIKTYLFDQYNDTMLTAIINLELQKYGYPFIVIRRRDIFFIENLKGDYFLYNNEPQTLMELIYAYVGNELMLIQNFFEEHPTANKLDIDEPETCEAAEMSKSEEIEIDNYDNAHMTQIATKGIEKIDKHTERLIEEFVEAHEDSDDPDTKKLVDAVVNQYEKNVMYEMFDSYAKQKAEPIVTLNQQIRRKKHASIAHILQDELSKRNLKQQYAPSLALKEKISLDNFLQILDKLDLEIIVREKLQTPDKAFKQPLLNAKPTQPVTEITQEHIDWWNNLPELWQKIFCVALYEPKKIARRFCDDFSTDWHYDDAKDNDDYGIDNGSYILGYSPYLKQVDDLLALFKIKQILYFQEVNPPIDEVVTFIPPMHYFTDLEILSIDSNYLEDISNLASLTRLKSLWLNECFTIEDYKPISHLTNLIELCLGFNSIKDIDFMKSLTELKNLFLCDNLIEDVSPLQNLTKLVSIDLSSNPIKDVRPLAHLSNLKELELGTDESANQGRLDDIDLRWLKEQLPNTEIIIW